MRYFFLFFTAVAIIAFFGKQQEQPFEQKLLIQAEQAALQISSKLTNTTNQKGKVIFTSDNLVMTEAALQQKIEKSTRNKPKANYTLFWSDSKRQQATASAMGLDWKHHFVNSYLVGIRPFAVNNNWLPLYTLSKRKTYEYDKKQYGALDLWQNSAQAFLLPRGDCEDHALALADWLISEGVDAKVVLGKYKTQGHAWVVASKNNKVYLLEATSKRVGKSWNHYPLAQMSNHYFPMVMFNRTEYWVNTTHLATTDYVGKHWQKTSEFVKFKS